MGQWKPLNADERRFIEKLMKEGRTINFIAKSLRRANSSIHTEVSKNGGRQNYVAEKAIALHANTKAQRSNNMTTARAVQREKRKEFISRVEALEMQIQILTEIIKEKR